MAGSVSESARTVGRARPILVVEHEASTCETLRLAAGSWGYPVFEARETDEALRLFDEHRPAVVIADAAMPELGGLELLRRLKERHPPTVVILITTYGTINDAVRAIKLGAADYLTKPLDFPKLKSLIETAMKVVEDPEIQVAQAEPGNSAFRFQQPPAGIASSKSVPADASPPVHRMSPS